MTAGDMDHAFEWYQRACDEHEPFAIFMAVNPFYSPLWRDPRFDDILRRMGLDKYFPERIHVPTPDGGKRR